MKAVLITNFAGPEALRRSEIAVPRAVGHDEVVIRVLSAGINPLDIMKRQGKLRAFYGQRLPMELGNDVFGEIVETSGVQNRFKKGEKVFCMVDSGKTLAITGFASGGGYAQYCVTKQRTLAHAPDINSPESLGGVPLAALTALQGLKKCKYTNKKSILVNGASGGVGLFVLQIARAAGLIVHTISNARAHGLLQELGADKTFDYCSPTPEYRMNRYDIIFDVASNMDPGEAKGLLNAGGVYLANVASPYTLVASIFGVGKQVFPWLRTVTYNWVKPSGEMLKEISGLIETGSVRIVIDKTFPLEAAASAHQYVEQSSVIGKVILDCR